ncbi:MAG TPA: GNAT family N-acetyltransferase [Opitutaceae bacterium]|nr:GNAT family N-acetyltransferase [Opitutaceae bacterium]
MPRPPEVFTTERLVARLPRVEDAEAAFAAYASDPEVTRYLSWRYYTEVEALRKFLRGIVRTWKSGEGHHYAWLLCLRGSDLPLGSIGVSFDVHGAMLGYVLGRSHWGRGLMTEAVRYVAAWALAQPPLFRVWAFCDAENIASARVLEKAGLRREGLLRRWHVCPTIGAEPRDCLIYARVR